MFLSLIVLVNQAEECSLRFIITEFGQCHPWRVHGLRDLTEEGFLKTQCSDLALKCGRLRSGTLLHVTAVEEAC